jgi:thioredoxin 1
MSSASTPTPSTDLLVACLCAQWCASCRDYRATFDEISHANQGMRFVWVDIEDEADKVDPVDVENFPTLLIASRDGVRFFGPVMPHKETLVRLLRSHREITGRGNAADADVDALARRLYE